ncbi:MAG: aminodeoxychorismate synthase component I [Arcobacter sp.]|nr:MAG: aminodeoxychorismate synthase component I [Arcobacter sp.]
MNLKEKLNFYGGKKEPFFFIISYDKTQYEVIPLSQLPDTIKFNFSRNKKSIDHNKVFEKKHIPFKEYKKKFFQLQEEIKNGNTYLANLTSQTKINSSLSFDEIYKMANAKFKLNYKDKFICFSPERFCEIKNNKIYTYPMKGTIDTKIKDAKKIILEDKKELAEHTMIVDLLRNDLSIVAKKVEVEKFRYCETIQAGQKELIQISSKISGQLEENWEKRMGDIISSLLPAGSITGTPKKKTVEILSKIEKYDRGYFTGVFGIYDGTTLDSAVIIRYLEKDKHGNLIYKSGGGITSDSDVSKEYQEMCDKVYIP